MSKQKPTKADPEDSPRFDQAAADQMAADMAADAESERTATKTDPLESLRTELQAAKDRALRSQAELENYRKRVAREMQEERRYANLPLMRALLPVLDNMQRAIDAAEKAQDPTGLLEGVKMVSRQLEDVLSQHGCVPIGAKGESFDPHLHEAISQQPSDEHPVGTVLLETQTGFQLHDRVVRPSQVIVCMANQQGGCNEEDERSHENADL